MAENKLEIMRHSCAHLVAAAVLELYPEAKFGVGPVVENGFYYDIDFPEPIGEEGLSKIEEKAKKLKLKNLSFERDQMDINEAIKFFKKIKQDYKVELLRDLKKKGTTKIKEGEMRDLTGSVDKVSVYQTGRFIDLCRGPHVKSTKDIGVFKLTKLAGAYWRGDEKNKMLTRIYGLAFETEKELADHLHMLAEAEKRDHRRLGKEQKIFIFSDLVGPGLPLWLPNGAIIIEELEKLAKETEEQTGYKRVRTPHIAKEEMYLTSGHLPYYAESMFPPMVVEENGQKTTYYLKAMNCPHHHQIYAAEPRSYRDLPLRLAEYGTCYRYEKSGELFGLMRVRSMQMNDAHIYCAEEQFEQEFMAVVDLYLKYFKIFGVEKYVMRLSTHHKDGLGKKYIDNEQLWQKTEEMTRRVMTKGKVPFVEVSDEAAFYGPKIDVQIWSVIGHEFTLATNQVDFAVPARFGLTYTDKDGKEKTPLCIHRAPLSTHERFIGFLIEHYGGIWPVWLAPVQIQFCPVARRHVEGAKKLAAELGILGIRVDVDDADETVGNKVRKAVAQKIPYILVVGDRELSGDEWVIRVRGQEEQLKMKKEEFVEKVRGEINNRN